MTEIDESTELPVSDAAHDGLVAFCSDLVSQIASGRAEAAVRQELAKTAPPEPPRSREWRHHAALALSTAEAANPDLPATPDRPGEHHCDICGCADEKQIQPGPDAEHFGPDKAAWMCRDERACEARKNHRYPPRADLVPDAVLAALSATDEEHARRRQQQAPVPPAAQQETAQEQETMPGWQVVPGVGAYNLRGDFIPAPPQYEAYGHTLMNPAHRAHLLSGQARPHYYGGHPGYIPPGVLSGGQSPDEVQGGQDRRTGIPPEGLSPGQAEALHGGHGIDIQAQSPAAPEAIPVRPARRSGRMPQYGRRVRGR